jgi:hypothetical protein
MKYFRLFIMHLVLLSLAVSACEGLATEVSPDSESPLRAAEPEKDLPALTPSPATTVSEPPDIVKEEPVLIEIIGRAITDLIERLGISEDQVRVIDVKEVAWPDASLGCPQPGRAYAQVTTPGYWILLEASGGQYPYHTDMDINVFLCQENALPSFPVTPGEIDDGQPWMPVD